VKTQDSIIRLHRAILIICGLALATVIVLPIWRIELDAAQYPEGLELLIYSYKLDGQVEVINGLNHYIGMRTLHADDFIEFTVLPYLIGIYALAFVLVGALGRRKLLHILFSAFLLFGIVSMVDFWRWLYEYGHDLDPAAPIKVPGMAYQPPLIGFKQLLNFGAFSIPGIGGWIFIACGVLLTYCAYAEWRITRIPILGLALAFSLQACGSDGPKPINFGNDQCAHCRMTVSDARFASQLVTTKGRAYSFDDVQCMVAFVKSGGIAREEVARYYLPDYSNENKLLPADGLFLLKSESLKSPMRGDIAAFANETDLEKVRKIHGGQRITWEDLWK